MTEDFKVIDCCTCGVEFGMPEKMLERRRNDGDGFFCPNGHAQQFTKDSKDIELRTLRQDLAEANSRAEVLQKLVDELRLELEIWKPASVEASSGKAAQ